MSDEIAARTRSRRKTVEGRSKLYHEPEEMEIRDIDDEDEHSHVSQPAITVSPVTPRRARSPRFSTSPLHKKIQHFKQLKNSQYGHEGTFKKSLVSILP